MSEMEQYLSKIAEAQEDIKADVQVGYFDDDIIMIDNVKLFSEPSATRMQMNVIAICQKGRVQLELNGEPTTFGANQIIMCPPGTLFTNMLLSPDFVFKAVFLTDRILHAFLREKISIWTETLYINRQHVVTIEPDAIEFLSLFYSMLNISINRHGENPYKTEVVQSLVRAAVLGMCGVLETMKRERSRMLNSTVAEVQPPAEGNAGRQVKHSSSSQSIFQRFLSMLNREPCGHRSVQSFADELCITPKYLSAVCKRNSGKTANAWITEHQMEDIRYYLRQTDLSIKEVCNLLGFPNGSFFAKYVKEHFGVTPTQLRQQ
jgi:AraC-like DNA-binding protein